MTDRKAGDRRDGVHKERTNLLAASSPSAVLLTAIRRVPAMKYAVAVAGVTATVATIVAFGLSYSVMVIGSLFTVGMMYVLLSFSRYAAKPTSRSRILNASLAWIFSGLIVLSAVLLTTAVSFGWPATLQRTLRANLLPSSKYWKIKVYNFDYHGRDASQNRMGERFASRILDALERNQLYVVKTGATPLAIVPARAGPFEAADVQGLEELAPVVLVSGYLDETEIPGEYSFVVRGTVASGSYFRTMYWKEGRVKHDSESMRATAIKVARDITAIADEASARLRK